MVKNRQSKVLFGAWISDRLVACVDNWLKTQPPMNRSEFLISAVDEKLSGDGIVLPRDAVEIRRRKEPVHRSPRKSRGGEDTRTVKSRANKVHFDARVDERLVGGVELWLDRNPQSNRTAFLIAAVVEKLRRKGITPPADATQIKRPRKPLGRAAYVGIDLSQTAQFSMRPAKEHEPENEADLMKTEAQNATLQTLFAQLESISKRESWRLVAHTTADGLNLTSCYIRDTKTAMELKKLYNGRCQICGKLLEISPTKFYLEARHLKPLGSPHNGPDHRDNIICLCANCNVCLDFNPKPLNARDLKIVRHSIGKEFIEYHNSLVVNNQNQPVDQSHQRWRGTVTIDCNVERARMQKALIEELRSEYSKARILRGNDSTPVSVVTESELILFEINPNLEFRTFIRQALGQILDYAVPLSSKQKLPIRLVVVGQFALSAANRKFLTRLKHDYQLPITYREVSI